MNLIISLKTHLPSYLFNLLSSPPYPHPFPGNKQKQGNLRYLQNWEESTYIQRVAYQFT